MSIPKGYRLTKNEWHYFSCFAVYVDDRGYIIRAMKKDRNGCWVSTAVYAPCKTGGYDNIMPCSRRDFRRKGVII